MMITNPLLPFLWVYMVGLTIETTPHISRPSLGLYTEKLADVNIPKGVVLSVIHINVTDIKRVNFNDVVSSAKNLMLATKGLCSATRKVLTDYLKNDPEPRTEYLKFANLNKNHMCSDWNSPNSEIESLERLAETLATAQKHVLKWNFKEFKGLQNPTRLKRDIHATNMNLIADRTVVDKLIDGKTLPGLVSSSQPVQSDQGRYVVSGNRDELLIRQQQDEEYRRQLQRWHDSHPSHKTTTEEPSVHTTTTKRTSKLEESRKVKLPQHDNEDLMEDLKDQPECPKHCKARSDDQYCADTSDAMYTKRIWGKQVNFISKDDGMLLKLLYWLGHNLPPSIPESITARSRRSLLPFVGDIYHKLFGLATDSQIDLVKTTLSNMTELTEMTGAGYKNLTDNQIMLSDLLDRGLKAQTDRLLELQNNTDQKISAMSNMTRWMESGINELQAHVTTTDAVMMSQSIRIDAQSNTQRIIFDMMSYKTLLDGVLSALLTHGIPPYIVSSGAITNLIVRAKSVLPPDMELTPTIANTLVLARMKVVPMLINETLSLTLALPFREKETTYALFAITTLPIFVNGIWIRADIPYKWILYNSHKQIYAGLTQEQVTECLDDDLRVCLIRGPWHTIGANPCVESAVQSWNEVSDRCKLVAMRSIPSLEDRVVQQANNVWAYSPLPDGVIMTMTCTEEDVVKESSLLLTYPVEIKIPPLCSVLIEDLRLTGDIMMKQGPGLNVVLNASIAETMVIPVEKHKVMITSMLGNVISSLSSKRSLLNETVMNRKVSVVQDFNVKEYQSLLRKEQRRFTSEFSSKIDVVKDNIKALGNSTDHWSIPYLTWGTLENVLGLVGPGTIMILLIAWCILRSPSAHGYQGARLIASATPMLQGVPRGFAAVVIDKLPDLTNATTGHGPISINATNVSNATNSSTSTHLSRIGGFVDNHEGALMVMLCMLVAIFLHCQLRSYIKLIFTRVTKRYPKIKNYRALAGEMELSMHFLIRFSGPLMHGHQLRVIGVRLSTLPGNLSSWRVVTGPSISSFISPRIVWNRIGTRQPLNLVWSPNTICIKHTKNQGIETCSSMPPQLCLTNNDIYYGCEGHTPWFWTKVEIISALSVCLHMGMNSSVIFNRVDHEVAGDKASVSQGIVRNPAILNNIMRYAKPEPGSDMHHLMAR